MRAGWGEWVGEGEEWSARPPRVWDLVGVGAVPGNQGPERRGSERRSRGQGLRIESGGEAGPQRPQELGPERDVGWE